MRGGEPLGRCIACAPARPLEMSATFVRYGGHPLCREHAVALVSGSDLPFVRDALERARRAVAAVEPVAAGGGRLHEAPGGLVTQTRPAGDQRPEGLLRR